MGPSFRVLGAAALCALSAFAASSQAEPAPPRRGEFTDSATPTAVIGIELAEKLSKFVAPDEDVQWHVIVPETYDPQRPAGLLVYISPYAAGRPPTNWRRLMEERNLIWIGADKAGNDVIVAKRIGAALLGAAYIERAYAIDAKRLYLAGFSGGAKAAGDVAEFFPAVFRGFIYIGGAISWKKEPSTIEAMRSNRYVFIAGANDFNLDETKQAFHLYQQAGFDQVRLSVVPGMGHDTPSLNRMRQAIDFLDNGSDP